MDTLKNSNALPAISTARKYWIRFWLELGGLSRIGRIAYRFAAIGLPPYYGRVFVAGLNSKGYISPRAVLHHPNLSLGKHIFIGKGVLLFRDAGGSHIHIGDSAKLIGDSTIQTGHGGECSIGARTCIQPHCQFSAYLSNISVGCDVEIAPYCAFYPYNHGSTMDKSIQTQPLQSKGDIIIGDEAWLGVGVIVLDGVRIGRGAIVGAGSVVTKNLPDFSISAGAPARVIKMRTHVSDVKQDIQGQLIDNTL